MIAISPASLGDQEERERFDCDRRRGLRSQNRAPLPATVVTALRRSIAFAETLVGFLNGSRRWRSCHGKVDAAEQHEPDAED